MNKTSKSIKKQQQYKKPTKVLVNGMKVSKSKISYKNPKGGGFDVRLNNDTDPLDILLPVVVEPTIITISDQ